MSVPAPQIQPARRSEEPPLPEFELDPPLSRWAVLVVLVAFGLSGLVWVAIVWAVLALLG